jgi:hypothetical protein
MTASRSDAIRPRRVRIERGIYYAHTGKLEIGWRDAHGKQRWKIIDGDIDAARATLRDRLIEKRAAHDALAAELYRRDRESRRRGRRDWAEAYASVRRALQSLDQVEHIHGTGAARSRAQDALYRAEDAIVEAMRCVY